MQLAWTEVSLIRLRYAAGMSSRSVRTRKWLAVATITALLGLVTVLAAVNGCVGDDPVGASSSPSTSSSSGGAADGSANLDPDAAPSLNCPLGCLPPAAAGWTGPSAVYDGPTATKPASCPAQYTQKELEGHQGMSVGATTCDCGSGSGSNVTCAVTVSKHTVKTCGGTGAVSTINVPTATPCVPTLTNGSTRVGPAVLSGSCTYAATKVSGPAPAFVKENVACGLPQAAPSCAAQANCVATPIPDQPFTRLCIHKAGAEKCPSLDYAARFVIYKSVTDDRSCTCTAAPDGKCDANFKFYGDIADCSSSGQFAMLGSCPQSVAISLAPLAPTGVTCGAGTFSGSAGAVKDVDPVTFCCNK